MIDVILQQQAREINLLKNRLKKVREILNKFVIFKKYNLQSYEQAMLEINEVLE